MDFTGFLGNDAVKARLSGAFASGRVAHSYLICGPVGSGKHTLTRILCAAMQCEGRGEKIPCGVCSGCRKALEGVHPDIITVDDPEHKSMTVEPIRAARSDMFIRPNEGKRKIYIIPRGQDMNESAQNALLKILEEPPDYGVFLILSTNAERLLPTIRSRCVSFAVAPVSPADCTRYCAAQGVDKKTAALYSELFDGHIGTVLAVARDEARAAQVEKALELARAAAARDSYTAAVLLAAYEKDKAVAAALLTDFRAVAAAGLRSSPRAPVQGTQARQAVRLADAALQRLGAQVNPKIMLSVFAAKFRAL